MRRAAVGDELDAALAHTAAAADHDGEPLAFPAALRRVLARAIATTRAEGDAATATNLMRHYAEVMPRMRVAQLARTAEPAVFHAPLDWTRLPRLAGAIDRLYAVLDDAGVDARDALGASTAGAFRARSPTLAALYARTHYGGCMPLLYGYPADLAYFARREPGEHALIDRYLTAPLVHELCHLAPARAVHMPLHLDECAGGWLGVHVHPEFAYPAAGEDDAIFASPWLAQVGQALARAFGIRAVVRAHAGDPDALPASFLTAAARLGDADWQARRTLHFLSDTLDPAPWIALALAAGAGRDLADETLASLARLPLASLATALPADPAFDRAVVEDALRAMCLDNTQVDGSFRARTRLPDAPIAIDASACRVTTARRGVDSVPPSYWLPPAVAARLAAVGIAGYALQLGAITAIPAAAAAICEAVTDVARVDFALVARH